MSYLFADMLSVNGLGCERQRRQLFHDLDFSLKSGELLHVRGANGAGKSTLLRVLAGLYLDYEGDISWDLARPPLFSGHKPGIKNQLTCRENLAWMLRTMGLSPENVVSLLGAVGLEGYADVSCGQLSEGQRKKVSLARLFAGASEAFILDEPFAAIDAGGIERLEAQMATLLDEGACIVLTSHQPPQGLDCRTLDL